MTQLSLFDETEEDSLKKELAATKEQINNLRRGMFGRYDKIVNELTILQENVSKIHENLGVSSQCSKKGQKDWVEENEGKILDFPLRTSQ